jgi:hypothetical protein
MNCATLQRLLADHANRFYGSEPWNEPVARQSFDSGGFVIGPTISRQVGTQALFRLSSVYWQTEHSKLSISRTAAMASVRR